MGEGSDEQGVLVLEAGAGLGAACSWAGECVRRVSDEGRLRCRTERRALCDACRCKCVKPYVVRCVACGLRRGGVFILCTRGVGR